MTARCLPVLALLACTACGSESDERLTNADRSELAVHAESQSAVQQALLGIDQALALDATFDSSLSAEANAQAILIRAQAGASCVTASLAGTTVDVSFGPPPGCAVRGATVSGSLSATVSKTGSTLAVDVVLSDLVVDGKSVTGTVKLVTSNGTSFETTVSLASAGKSVTGSVTLTGAQGALMLAGTLSTTAGAVTTTASLEAVHYELGACYPDAGTLTTTVSRASTLMTFLSTTPADGKVKVKKGRVETLESLPAYGACPPAT